MNLRHLKSFLVVAEELNFGRAALRLHISQPPLTRQIQQLEEELGTQLFIRTNRGVELTQAGGLLVAEARNVLSLTDQAAERTRKAGRGELGRIDVGIFGSGILGLVPKILLTFKEAYPEVNMVLHNLTRREQVEALRQRRLTVAFNRLLQPEPDIAVETIVMEPLYLVVNSKAPLSKQKTVPWAEVGRHPLILFPSGSRPSFIDWVMEQCRRDRIVPQIVQEVGDAVNAVALVASGFGISIVPESATHLKLPGVVYRPLQRNGPMEVDLSCLYRSDDESPILRSFLTIARSFRRG